MILLTALVAPALAAAGDVRLGVLVEGSADLESPHEGTSAGIGPGLAVPLQIRIAPGTDLRLNVGAFGLVGHDRVEWTEETVHWYSDTHRAVYGGAQATAGVAFELAPQHLLDPYVGVDAGGALIAGWHTFSGGTASLRDGGASTQRDTLQVVPAIGGDVGVRLMTGSRPCCGVAVEVEAGYTVSLLPEAPLGEVPTAFGASRTAFALDRARMGFGVSFPLA